MKQEGVEEENLQDRSLEAPHSFFPKCRESLCFLHSDTINYCSQL